MGLPVDELAPRFGTALYSLRSYTRPRLMTVPLGAARRIDLPVRQGEPCELLVVPQRGKQEVPVHGCTPLRVGLDGSAAAQLVVPQTAVLEALGRLAAGRR